MTAVTEYIRKPQIEPQDDAFVKRGGTLKLNCTVNVAHDVQFNMWWQKSDKKRIETVGEIRPAEVAHNVNEISFAGFQDHREFGFG